MVRKKERRMSYKFVSFLCFDRREEDNVFGGKTVKSWNVEAAVSIVQDRVILQEKQLHVGAY